MLVVNSDEKHLPSCSHPNDMARCQSQTEYCFGRSVDWIVTAFSVAASLPAPGPTAAGSSLLSAPIRRSSGRLPLGGSDLDVVEPDANESAQLTNTSDPA